MKRITSVVAIALVLAIGVAVGYMSHVADARAQAASEESLSMYMSTLQTFSQKLGLAVAASNQPLADFYLTELNEQLATIQKKYPAYKGLQIAALSKAMMDPYTKPMGDAIATGDFTKIKPAYEKLITGCNGCHTATQRPFIKVVPATSNPYNQDFAK